jgi:zinc transport system substrate-binding protein
MAVAMGLLVLVAACGGDEPASSDDRPRFVTTIPPFEMILRPVVEGRATVERLLDPGASPHTYDPTPSDLRAVSNATALVYGAEHLDGWAANLPA